MVEYQPISTAMPLFSIIIAVYNDWVALDPCLRSLAQQTHVDRNLLSHPACNLNRKDGANFWEPGGSAPLVCRSELGDLGELALDNFSGRSQRH
jgi:hypothetical protein